MLAPLLAAALLLGQSPPRTVSAQQTRSQRLVVHILKIYPKAAPYASELASRILLESKRHNMEAAAMAAVAWIESDYRITCRGRHGEHGVWQLRPWDHGLQDGWNFVRARPAEFPIVRKVPQLARWAALGRHRIRVLKDIRASTYLGVYSIKRHVAMCRRLGHRVGRWRCNKPFVNQCAPVHKYRLDRLAHYNSGVSWPRPGYLRKLRGRTRYLRRKLR